MKTRNKTNLILLFVLALILTIACDSDEGTNTGNAAGDDVAATDTADDTTTAELDLSEDDSEGSETDDGSESDDGPVTVRFERGKTSKRYERSLTGGDSHTYYLTASKGQTMSIEIDSQRDDAGFTVYDPAGSELTGGEETTEAREFSEELSDSGRYRIVVASPRKVDYDIDFEVSAGAQDLTPDEAAGGANKTVRFGKGRSSASYSNSVIRGDRDTYILGARAGQFMTVSITSVEDNASFEILAPGGKELVLDDTDWTGELPRDGNYRIIVGSGRGNATYTIRFKVEQSPIDH